MRKIELFLNRLPENVNGLILRVGNNRNSEEICGRFNFPVEDNSELITEILDSLPEQGVKFRLLGMENGKQVKGLTINPTSNNQDITDPIQALTKGFLDMSYQVERILSTANSTIEHQQDTIEYLVDSLVQTKEENQENQLAIGLLEMEKNQLEQIQGQSAKEKALDLAEKTLATMMTPQKITPQMLKDVIKKNPQILEEFLKDEEFVSLISDKLLN